MTRMVFNVICATILAETIFTSVSKNFVSGQTDGFCDPGFSCVSKDICDDYLTKAKTLLTLRKNSRQYRNLLTEESDENQIVHLLSILKEAKIGEYI